MKRTDFRPTNERTSQLSDKDKTLIENSKPKYTMTEKRTWTGMTYYEVKDSKGKVIDTGTLDKEDMKDRKKRYNIQ